MNKTFRFFILFLFLAFLSGKDKFNISGKVVTQDGEGIKKAPVLLLDSQNKKVKVIKSKKDGTFTLKKIVPGSYTIKSKDEKLGSGIIAITVVDTDLEVAITLPSELEPSSISEPSTTAQEEGLPKGKFDVSGTVLDENGEGIKKANIILLDENDNKISDGKTKKGGVFKIKNIVSGKYIIQAEKKKLGVGYSWVTVWGDDTEIQVLIPSELPNESIAELKTDINDTNQVVSEIIETKLDSLPQQREPKGKPKLELGNLFFEYESNLKSLQSEIDSLKTIVQAYDQKQKIPDISREILEIINIPNFHHRIELQNGTVVLGNIEEETDSSLTLSTQIGRLVLKKEMVIRMDKYQLPAPKVEFIGDPFIDYFPDRQIISGKIKNVGKKRADFVRVIGNLWDQTTSLAGKDSIFVKGTRMVYDSEVIADTALEPEQTATYKVIIPIIKGMKPQYHTMEIQWEETQ
tara:strand:+ start:10199 stop:11584 length:1386 start_codon:yes stop_codon:yes gene_type:complete